MRVSNLLAAHDEGALLWKTIRAIVESCAGLDYEIVVADDASTDGSVREAERRYPQIRVVRNKRRLGASPTKHLAATHARGDVLVFLDGHCNPELGAIRRLVEDVEQLEGQAIVTPAVPALCTKTWTNKSAQVGHGYRLGLEKLDCGWIGLSKMRVAGTSSFSGVRGGKSTCPPLGRRKLYESPALIGCSLAISRALYDELHGFDPHMFYWGVEDLDFGLRSWLMGHPILHDPKAAIGHRFRKSFDTYSVPYDHLVVNQLRMARKCFTQSVWADWLDRCRQRSPQTLPDHPEGFWARVWELFLKHEASADSERAYLAARRQRDEFWYAERFGLSWPKLRPAAVPARAPAYAEPSASGSPEPSPGPNSVEIFRGEENITGKTVDVIVGQKISLTGRVVAPTGGITGKRWTIPGSTGAAYSQTKERASPTPLAPADLQNASAGFFWIDRDTGLRVQYDVVIDSITHSASATFNVVRPTATFTSVTITSIATPANPAIDVGPLLLTPAGTMWLHCGTSDSPALESTGTVTVPPGGAGKIGTTQVIKTVRQVAHNDGAKFILSSKGKFVADDDPEEPDDNGFMYATSVQTVAPGQNPAPTSRFADWPHQQVISGYNYASASDDFRLYLMYRPDGNDSIWVTLSRITWAWDGYAERTGNNWSVTGGDPPAVNPAGSDSTELPEWKDYFTNLVPAPKH